MSIQSPDRIALFFCTQGESNAVRAQLDGTGSEIVLESFDANDVDACPYDFVVIGSAVASRRAVVTAFVASVPVPAVLLLSDEDEDSHLADNLAALSMSELRRLPLLIGRELRLHRAEIALRESERRYRQLIDQAQEGVWVIDTAGKTTFANQKMTEMLGCSPDDLLGTSIFNFIDDEMRAVAVRNLHRRQDDVAEAQDFRFRRPGGGYFWGLLSTTPLFDDLGRYQGTLGLVSDITARKEVEATLRRRETQLSMAQELASLGSWEWDLLANRITGAPELRRMLNVDMTHPIRLHHVISLIHPEDVRTVCDAAERAVAARSLFEKEFRIVRADGNVTHVHARAQVVCDERGTPLRLTGMVQDITMRKAADRALQASEERYRNLVARIPDVTWTADDKALQFISPNVEALTGYTDVEILSGGHNLWASRVYPADRERIFGAYQDMYRRGVGAEYEIEFRFLRKDGAWIWMQERAAVSLETCGSLRAFGVLLDVTDRRYAEEALRDSESRYRTLVDQATDIIFSIDMDGRFTSLNPAFEATTGWEADEWIGRQFTDIFLPESVPVAIDHFKAVVSGAAPGAFVTYQVKRRDGGSVIIETTAQALVAGGQIAGSIGIARDVTSRRAAEAEQEREKRLASLGQLAASVAHEFNNVLMSILPFAELLRRRLVGDERVEIATKHIIQAIRRGRQISAEVLRFSRPANPELSSLDVHDWLADFKREAEALLGPKYRLEAYSAIAAPLFIVADRALLEQVATNLVINARDAMPGGGRVTLEVRRGLDPRQVEIGVRDDGPGMSPELLDRIFDPLFTTKPSGNGLGLTIAFQAMSLQRGTLRVSSTPGAGSLFSMVFQQTEPPEAETSPRTALNAARGRVLLVEDDEAVGEGLRSLMADEGFEIRVVTRGLDAPRAIEEFLPDVVLLDVNLPDINGVELYERVHLRWPSLPVIFSTGHADASALEDVRRRQVPSIMKPYEIVELLEVMEQSCTKPRERRGSRRREDGREERPAVR
ncbi:MAG TPA: PAS domain S-box protein [Thermoanaerobaculia bacterium]|jgi:PAS domain S-box-containing protein